MHDQLSSGASRLPDPPRYPSWLQILSLLLVLLTISAADYAYFQYEQRSALRHTQERLNLLGNLKARTLAAWLQERHGNAATLRASRIGTVLRALMETPIPADVQEDVQHWLNALARHYGYRQVQLLNTAGETVLGTASDPPVLSAPTQSFVQQALFTGQVIFTDIYGTPPHLDFVTPIFAEPPRKAPPTGVLLLCIDPRTLLFPMLSNQSEPGFPIRTLLARQGETGFELIAPSLQLTGDADATDVKAILADLGQTQALAHSPWLTVSQAVTGTPWTVVVSINREDFKTPSRRDTLRLLGVILLLMLVASLLAWFLWRRQTELLLRHNRDYLEAQVRERTAELEASNASLRGEVLERRRVERERDSIFTLAPDLMSVIGPDGYLQRFNPAWERSLGYGAEELAVRALIQLIHPDDRDKTQRALNTVRHGAHITGLENRVRRADGDYLWLEWSGVAALDRDVCYCTARDISERKAYEVQLRYQANHDGLTGLPNRNLLQERLGHALDHATRAGRLVAVLFLDLDRFKTVNDTLGYGAGDCLLKLVAARLQSCVRQEDTVARLGNDEFVIVLENLTHSDLAMKVAHKARDALTPPFSLNDQELHLTTSIGISLFPRDGREHGELLKNAVIAVHRTKEMGRGEICFYSAEMNARFLERLTLENKLRHALDQGEILLYYQPQVSLSSGRVVGVEALLRWRHPQQGMMPQDEFIPLAEETGLIIPLGEWALKTACAQARTWLDQGVPTPRMAVNLSALQFIQGDLPSLVGRVLAETGLPPGYLELELTESLLMKDMDGAVATLQALKSMGVSLAIDDFGTGYSSLNYLKRLPIDRLKIDKSFVRDITNDPNDAAIAQAVVAMANSLRLGVVAEGVETKGQLAFLRAKGCEELQGFYFSPPLPPAQLEAYLRGQPFGDLRPEPEDQQRPTLLLVDDEEFFIRGIKHALSHEDYRILAAADAASGFETLARHKVDVILSDHAMPGMDGVRFLKRARELYPNTLRIILSGHSDSRLVLDAINEGSIYKYLCKPVDADLLRAVLHDAFQVTNASRRIRSTERLQGHRSES